MVSTKQSAGEAQIPIIDMRSLNSDAPRQLLEAATGHGFVFIEPWDIGIEQADVDQIFKLSKNFFASPLDVKEEVSISSNKAGKNYGWLSQGVEKLDPATQRRPDVKESVVVNRDTWHHVADRAGRSM